MEEPKIGKHIYIIGHPLKFHYSVNYGLVSNYVDRKFENHNVVLMLLATNAISGNSGGAVVTNDTKLVGIVIGVMYLEQYNLFGKEMKTIPHLTFAIRLQDIRRFIDEQSEFLTSNNK